MRLSFEADVLATNKAMLAVFDHAGLPIVMRRDGGTAHTMLSLR